MPSDPTKEELMLRSITCFSFSRSAINACELSDFSEDVDCDEVYVSGSRFNLGLHACMYAQLHVRGGGNFEEKRGEGDVAA